MKKNILSMMLTLAVATVFASTQTKTTEDKPGQVYLLGATMNASDNISGVENDYYAQTIPLATIYTQIQSGNSVAWLNGLGGYGSGTMLNHTVSAFYYSNYTNYDNTLENDSMNFDGSGLGYDDQSDNYWGSDDGNSYSYARQWTNNYAIISSYVGNEHCDVTDSARPPFWIGAEYTYDLGVVLREVTTVETYQRYAQAAWHVHTGGKAIPGRQSLWQFSGSAQSVTNMRAGPPYNAGNTQSIANLNSIALGNIGSLQSDGTLWRTLPDNSDIDVTPMISGNDFYQFNVSGQKYPVNISLTTATTNANLDCVVPEVCVGQQVTFALNGLPMGSISNMVGQWGLPAIYVNADLQYVAGVTSPNYYVNDWLLQNTNQTSCWFVNGSGGHVLVGLNILFTDGQYAGIAANGDITVYRPSFTNFSTANTSYGVFTNSPRTFLWSGNTNSYGNSETGEHGQFWSANVNSKYDGAIGILQLVNAEYTQNYGWCPDCRDTLNTGGDFALDGSPTPGFQDPNNYNEILYYSNNTNSYNIYIDDQPKEELWAASPINVRLWGQFQDYLRFRPSGVNAISITLATNNWSMEGIATVASGIITNSTPLPSAPSDSDAFPIWSQVKESR